MITDKNRLQYDFDVREEVRRKSMEAVKTYKRNLRAKIKLYYDNGNFDYQTVMNIIKNI